MADGVREVNAATDPRIDVILGLLMELAAGNLSARAEHANTGDELDAITECINMLAEELSASTVSRRFLENVLRSMVDMLVVCDPDRTIRLANDAVCEALGYDPGELVGEPAAKIFAASDGLPASPEAILVQEPGGEDREHEREVDFVKRDGKRLPVKMRWSVVRDTRGRVEAVIIAARDLSERRLAEQEMIGLSSRYQSQKLEAIGNLAGGVAHDINNMLTGIIGLASAVHADLRQGDPLREDMDGILSACYRGRDLTRNLLGFARKGNYRYDQICLNDCVNEVQRLLERTIPKNVTIRALLGPDLAKIGGDPAQINHLLVNLALNAVDAMSGEGVLTLATENTVVDEGSAGDRHRVAAGPYVRVTVTDTGVGMDAETAERAFEPFFTTKPAGRGTGLGLSMVHGTVKSHGGEVTLESIPGRGTTVTVLLPALTSAHAAPAPPSPAVLHQGVGTILFVDDEEIVRKNGKRLLERLGYKVILAEDGRVAVERYGELAKEIVLVILDLVMPTMNGEEAFRRIRELDSEARVLLSSGYSREHLADQLIRRGAIGFLQKPYDLSELEAALREILPRAAGASPARVD